MKAENFIAAIERFFLDLIGSVVPGGLLIGGLWMVLGRSDLAGLEIPPQGEFQWIVLIVASYVLGHLVTSVGRLVVEPVGPLATWLRGKWAPFKKVLPGHVASREESLQRITKGEDYRGFVDLIKNRFTWAKPGTPNVFFPARNLAISLVPEREHRVFRFMFLSLLNFGVATALLAIVGVWGFAALLVAADVLTIPALYDLDPRWAIVCVLLALFWTERGYYFQDISWRVPFPMAAVAVLQGAFKEAEPAPKRATQKATPRIYLAGGFYSGWQERVVEVWTGACIDPRLHKLKREAEYTMWDLEAIRASDWVVAYLEKTNPAGFALALEVGFAKALGKRVILIDEKSKDDATTRRHLSMVWAAADVTFDDFEEALEFLRKWDLREPRQEED